jgi:prepilin-type N-terminal cleavage/methylation domain-containing protein
LLTERIRGESGYSLVEVMASIVILSIAIIPLVGMFDMGLQNATRGSNYDKSRALANLKLEEAKTLPFAEVENNFPEAATPLDDSGNYESPDWMKDEGEPYWDDNYANFAYKVEKQYMRQPSKAPGSATENFLPCDQDSVDPTIACSPGTGLIRVTITVGWGYDEDTESYRNTYTTLGLVSA